MSNLPFLPNPDGWEFSAMTPQETRNLLEKATAYDGDDPALLTNLNRARVLHMGIPVSNEPHRRGWQRPGPGPTPGRSRLPTIEDLTIPLSIALIHLVEEAIHFQQTYAFQSQSTGGDGIDFSTAMWKLADLEKELSFTKTTKKTIWTPTHQLGVPAVLIKLRSPHHAISLHFLPDRPGEQWYCSFCTTQELNVISSCAHVSLLRQCKQRISNELSLSPDFLLCSMNQSSAFNHMSDLSSTCFYGVGKKLEFAIVRHEQSTFEAPATSHTRIHLAKHTPNARKWSCLNRACAGRNLDCAHQSSVQRHIDHSGTFCFPSLYDIMNEQAQFTSGLNPGTDTEIFNVGIPRHSRPLIPSETSFIVDHSINRNARNNRSSLLKAATTCHCGRTMFDSSSSDIIVSDLRIETSRCFVNYRQEVWTCQNGHCVTPEECAETREGMIWISRDTAFTEVFLFDLMLHMTLGGGTIAGQSDLRSQLLFLQTHYTSRRDGPRSNQCIRKALISYAMAVVKAIPPWVFRCDTCSSQVNGSIYYDKLSFDGQQLGFNIKRDVRYDFYGKPATPWRRPVDRCPEGPRLVMIIRSKHLRGIVTEVLRVRAAPRTCNSVQALCRKLFTTPLRSKEAIRAAVAAIKLFDPLWSLHLPIGAINTIDTTFDTLKANSNNNLRAHPFSFITEVNDQSDFERCVRVRNVFRDILDCTRAAAVISILLNELRNDLKAHIPPLDKQFIANYANWANSFIQAWLLQITSSETTTNLHSSQGYRDVQDELSTGIGEHVDFLHHPFRPPFAWKRAEGNVLSQTGRNLLCKVRNIHEWVPPAAAQTPLLLLVMAVFTEPVTVWIRNGDLAAVRATEEVLRTAELHAGENNTSLYYRASLQEIHRIGLLYEGVMGMIGANLHAARPMFSIFRRAIQLIPDRYNAYISCMAEFTSTKSFMCSPREFDNMLLWTGAVGPHPNSRDGDNTNEDANNPYNLNHHGRNMGRLYPKMASSKSKDFMETGIWAPDFPTRRPSPSSTALSANTCQIDISCSKDFTTNTAFSPGTFGAYCLCHHAKTVMISFLKRPEGCRMPLNLIVERCARLPRYVIYDFACGTQKSALGLSAELSKHIRFAIDPFHFPGHKTCSLAMHGANYSELRGNNVESQEQRNNSIKVMEKTLRASRDIHFMHFVVLSHAYHNLKAIYLDHYDRTEAGSSEEADWGSRAWMKWIRDNLFSTQ